MKQKIAIVILNWNGKKLLDQFLPNVIKYSTEAKIYFIDNASDDESVNFLQQNFPSVQLILNSENYGFAAGYNIGLKNLTEHYLVLLNSDVEVTENWLNPLLTIFETQPEIGIIQPKILDFKNKKRFEYAGAGGGFIDQFGFPFCRGRIFDTIEEDKGQYNESVEIFWASGACFAIRSEVFKRLNGFDSSFFAHQEEIDLCWRAFNRDIKTIYEPKSVVYHIGGATLNQSNPKKTFLNFRNSLLMLLKNLPKNKIFVIIFIRLCLDGLAGIQFLFKLKPKHTFAIIKAHFCFYKMFFEAYKKRGNHQKQNYFKTKSIVFDYYLFNKKKF